MLLISSATMAFAVRAAREQRRTALALRLFATAGLGVLFLGVKGCEYAREISEHSCREAHSTFRNLMPPTLKCFSTFIF